MITGVNEEEKKFQKMKRVIDLLNQEKNETLGIIKQLLTELKDEFGCDDLEAADKKAKQLKLKKKKYGKRVDKILARFDKDFGKLVTAIEKSDPEVHRIAKKCIKGTKARKKRSKKT